MNDDRLALRPQSRGVAVVGDDEGTMKDLTNGLYMLDENGTPVPATDIHSWGVWKQNNDPHIPNGDIERDGIRVSTVFLGMDHSFEVAPHIPILWETMIFGGEHSEYQERYTSLADAIEGHQRALAMAFGNS